MGYSQCAHDFVSNDSWLTFTPPTDGDWFVQVRDLNGGGRVSSVYRLSIESLQPDLLVYQWPDAVPIWGPGTTASFVVEVMKWGPLHEDVEVSVEGLPDGWKGGTASWPKTWYSHYQGTGTMKLLLTITAALDAEVGTIVPFRVVGRSEHEGRRIEREAQYMTLYGPSHNDRMHVRHSPVARAVVASFRDASISTDTTEVTGKVGETVDVPVRIQRHGEGTATIGIVANGPTPSVGVGWSSPLTLAANQTEATCQISLAGRDPGRYAIVIARSWASDTRAGRSGPCTKTFWLNIKP
ncbi:MAG: hypothetical protein ACI92S_004838 [Planctomycetaceae bacterium]|jgi:hypothetical protein